VTSTRILARNTLLSLVAQLAPLLVAVVTVPLLIKGLGSDRFGVLTLAWTLIGYFGLFDFGLGRALVQAVSEALAARDEERLRDVTALALTALFALGVVAAVILATCAHWLAYDVLQMEDSLRSEAASSFVLLALSLPFVITSVGLRGVFEAHQHFGIASALRLPYGVFSFVGPLVLLPYTVNLTAIVAAIVVGRVLTAIAYVIAARHRYPWLRMFSTRNPKAIVPLLHMGSWMTVSNVVSPILSNMDRFLIGAMISMSAVAYYVTPYEVVTKLLIVPGAVLAVFFPAFAATHVTDPRRTAVLLGRVTRMLLIFQFPAIVILIAFAGDILRMWVGPDFAVHSALVLKILAFGVLINSLGQVPYSLLQATGRPDIPAKLHLAELPIYVVLIFALANAFGLAGVAMAWTLRIAIDTSALWWIARRRLTGIAEPLPHLLAWAVVVLAGMLLSGLPGSFVVRATAATVLLGGFAILAWSRLLAPDERTTLTATLLARLASPRAR
jgi:O-antigen/teichoic acid export membrane protein